MTAAQATINQPSAAKRLATNSLLYLLPNLLVRGLSLLLAPVYVRVMSPSDFGLVAVATTSSSLLAIAFGLALFASFGRPYLEQTDEPAQRRFVGTLLIAILIIPPLIAVIFDRLGASGLLY